jgi:hypothetical protein
MISYRIIFILINLYDQYHIHVDILFLFLIKRNVQRT